MAAGKPPGPGDAAGWSVELKPGAPAAPPPASGPLPAAWSQQDIDEGRARCSALLKGLDLVAVPVEPIRQGTSCGTPAPMQLVSVGSNPPITFSPHTVLTCDMIVALDKWLEGDVQPLARKHLGAPVVGVNVMSTFSCRNAYGRAHTRLSEHGRVNAIDVGSFLTAKGETAQVVADWGPIARDSAGNVTAEQAETVKRQAEAAAQARKGKVPEAPRIASPATVKTVEGSTVSIGLPSISFGAPQGPTGLGFAPPSRLGGPKATEEVGPVAPPMTAKAAFLHEVHNAACAIFTTVLGPEANKAHKNHFHLDMAPRHSGHICE